VNKSGGDITIRDAGAKFKIESTGAKITARAGLVRVERLAQALGVGRSLDWHLRHLKKRKRGYRISEKVMDLVWLYISGGEVLSDPRELGSDEMMKRFLGRNNSMAYSTAMEFLSQLSADKNQHMLQIIEAIAADKWEVFADDPNEKIAQSVYSFNRGNHAYRIAVLRRAMRQLEIFGGIWEYRVIITNMTWDWAGRTSRGRSGSTEARSRSEQAADHLA